MTLVQFNSKDHPGHWESHTARPQVLRFILLSLVRVLWETRKSISFILNLDCSSSWTFTKAAGPRGGVFQNPIWSQVRTLWSQSWHYFIENRQWVLDLISTFTPCRYVPFPRFLGNISVCIGNRGCNLFLSPSLSNWPTATGLCFQM